MTDTIPINTTPEEPWVAGYQAAMTAFLLENATLVSADTNQAYGWIAPDYDHKYTCPLTLANGGSFHENSITEFHGTFEGNTERVVIDASPINCGCGAIKNRTVRYDGTLSDLLTTFLGGLDNLT